jgi:hypothetical protein
MKLHRLAFAISVISVAMLASGCSSTDAKPKESSSDTGAGATAAPAKKEPVLYSGQQAFNRMLVLAMKWAPDAQPARLESVLTTETNGHDGKSAVWRGYFASPSRRAVKTFVCSGSRLRGAPPFGVSTEGGDSAYNSQSASLAFSQYLLKSDTDGAATVAQQHGGDALLKKDAEQPITYVLLKDKRLNGPAWYVIYGPSETDRKGIAVVNAATGTFVSAGK